jgi:hypothetical protein
MMGSGKRRQSISLSLEEQEWQAEIENKYEDQRNHNRACCGLSHTFGSPSGCVAPWTADLHHVMASKKFLSTQCGLGSPPRFVVFGTVGQIVLNDSSGMPMMRLSIAFQETRDKDKHCNCKHTQHCQDWVPISKGKQWWNGWPLKW